VGVRGLTRKRLRTLTIGRGSSCPSPPLRYSYSHSSRAAAAAFAAASDTPRRAFAPRRDLFGVPSSSHRRSARSPDQLLRQFVAHVLHRQLAIDPGEHEAAHLRHRPAGQIGVRLE
jgi:hypothetical protein